MLKLIKKQFNFGTSNIIKDIYVKNITKEYRYNSEKSEKPVLEEIRIIFYDENRDSYCEINYDIESNEIDLIEEFENECVGLEEHLEYLEFSEKELIVFMLNL